MPTRRTARSHAGVLDAAAAVAARRGYRAAAIEEIAVAAGVAKQTVYRWWPSKSALYVDVYARLVPVEDVAPDTGSLPGDLEQLLATLSELYADTAAAAILSGLVAEAQADPDVAARLRETWVTPRRRVVAQLLERAVARGDIPPPEDAAFVSDLFSGAVWFRLLLGEGRLDPEFRRRFVEAVLRSVRFGESGPREGAARLPSKHTSSDGTIQ